MKIRKIWIIISSFLLLGFLITLPVNPPDVMAQGGSPNDHGRQPSDDDIGIKNGELFGDLWLIIRNVDDENDGKPVLFKWTWPQEAYNDEGDLDIQWGQVPESVAVSETEGFLQPYGFEPIPNPAYDPDTPDTEEDQFLQFKDTIVDSYGNVQTVYLIPLDDEGKVPDAYEDIWANHIMEADLGRYNVARSTQYVLDEAYDEAIRPFTDGTIGLDPAGRLMVTVDGQTKVVDSHLQNIALYQKLMLNGFLPGSSAFDFEDGLEHLRANDNGEPESLNSDDFLRAASFLGGAADKFCRLNADMLIYVNTLLGINKVERTTNDQGVEIPYISGYFDFNDFAYDRLKVSRGEAELLQIENDGIYQSQTVDINDSVFAQGWPLSDEQSLFTFINFLRAADDALSVVFYTHNFEVPEAFTAIK